MEKREQISADTIGQGAVLPYEQTLEQGGTNRETEPSRTWIRKLEAGAAAVGLLFTGAMLSANKAAYADTNHGLPSAGCSPEAPYGDIFATYFNLPAGQYTGQIIYSGPQSGDYQFTFTSTGSNSPFNDVGRQSAIEQGQYEATVTWDNGSGVSGSYGPEALNVTGCGPTGIPQPGETVNKPVITMARTPDGNGYWLVGQDGSLQPFGDAEFHGSLAGTHLNAPIVGMAPTSDGGGYWLLGRDGGIFSFGDANFYGSTGGIKLNQPIVGISSTADSKGYWLVAADGGIFSYGDARFYGSTGGIKLNQPVVGIAPTNDGRGYYMVAKDGGMFTFGDAEFHGSTGNVKLNQPVVGMSTDPVTGGYWLVAADGGMFSFDAPFYGSTGNIQLAAPIVGMTNTPDGQGYRIVATDGGIFSFGDAHFYGSAA